MSTSESNGDVQQTMRLDGRSVEGREAGRLSERVRQYVFDQILSGSLAPGTMIQIGTLAREVGVSRTPAREALLSLQEAGLVSVVPNHGFLVKSVSLVDITDIYVTRQVLEEATAERAAEHLDDVARDRLRVVHERARDRSMAGVYDIEFDRLCHEFHRGIAEGARSSRLLAAVQNIFGEAARLQSIGVNPPDPTVVVAQHELILQALIDQDPTDARRTMAEHIETLQAFAVATLSG